MFNKSLRRWLHFILVGNSVTMGSSCSNKNVPTEVHNRGLAALEQRDHDLAIEDFTEAIRISPNLAQAYHERGAAYEKEGDRTKAQSDFAKAKELASDSE